MGNKFARALINLTGDSFVGNDNERVFVFANTLPFVPPSHNLGSGEQAEID